MSRLIGLLDMLVGVIFVTLGLLALTEVPAAFGRLVTEPENFYLSIFLFVSSLAIGIIILVVGSVLLRRRLFIWRISPSTAFSLGAGLAVLLMLISLIGFWPDDPASRELRLLLIPAALLGISLLLLRDLKRRSGEVLERI